MKAAATIPKAMNTTSGAPPLSAANPTPKVPPAAPSIARSDLSVVRRLLPYLWEYKWRVLLALAFLVTAKVANVGVPLIM